MAIHFGKEKSWQALRRRIIVVFLGVIACRWCECVLAAILTVRLDLAVPTIQTTLNAAFRKDCVGLAREKMPVAIPRTVLFSRLTAWNCEAGPLHA